MADLSDTSRWWFNCVSVSVWVCEWVSLCVRGHVAILLGAWWMADYETLHVCMSGTMIPAICANKNVLRYFTGMAHHSRDAATGFAAVATRPRAGCWSMEDRRRKSLINWPYQPKHSPSNGHPFRFAVMMPPMPWLLCSQLPWQSSLSEFSHVQVSSLFICN